jgi:hypothetical protein
MNDEKNQIYILLRQQSAVNLDILRVLVEITKETKMAEDSPVFSKISTLVESAQKQINELGKLFSIAGQGGSNGS